MNTVEPIRDMKIIWNIEDYLKDKNARDYMMFEIGIYCGLRISDILKLQVRAVRDKTHISIREQKTGKEKRFKINPDLQKVIKSYIVGKEDYEFLLPSRQGANKHITRQRAYDILKDVADNFGIEYVGTHTLRKTFGYHFYMQTKDIATLKEIYNHSDISVTFRYIGINQDRKDDMMCKLSYKRH